MRPRRVPAVAALCATAVLATAASAVADPPWSPPTAVPGVASGPAVATAAGNVVAFTSSDRRRPPGTAS